MKKKTVIWLILLVMSMALSGCSLKNPDFSVSKTGSCTYAQTIKHPV